MVKKQVIWSGFAKQKLYSAIKDILQKEGDREAKNFFRAVSGKIRKLRKGYEPEISTSNEKIKAFFQDRHIILYENTELNMIIHTIEREDYV